jgi:ubiquinone biosynthesis protein UbiJ
MGTFQPPPWLLQELQQKLVLFINHVLLASPEALVRTRALTGRSVQLRWQSVTLHWVFTPAGLLEQSDAANPADLSLSWGELGVTDLADRVLRGQRPPLRIEGDVEMASAIQWLADHVRWDFREDLARLMGDAPAQALVVLGQRLIDGLRQFVAKVPGAQRA